MTCFLIFPNGYNFLLPKLLHHFTFVSTEALHVCFMSIIFLYLFLTVSPFIRTYNYLFPIILKGDFAQNRCSVNIYGT